MRDCGLPGAGLTANGTIILLPAGPQPRRVDAAGQPLGNPPLEAGLPPGILEVVVVEVNGPVLRGQGSVIRLAAAPVAARGGAHRQVDGAPVQLPGRGVRNPGRGDVEGEIPARDQVLCRDRFFPRPELIDFFGGEGAPEKAGAVDPAVEMGGGDRVAFPGPLPVGRHQEVAGAGPGRPRPDRFGNRSRGVFEGPRGERLLVQTGFTGGVPGCGNRVPARSPQTFADADSFDSPLA